MAGIRLPVDIKVATAGDLEQQANNPGLVFRTILQEGRYPGTEEAVTEDEYLDAVRLASAVVAWAGQIISLHPR